MLTEFKKFVARGNVIDLSVGIIIGSSFGRVVQSIVEDIVMPLVSLIMGGGADFSNYFLPLSSDIKSSVISEARKQGAVFAYGNFITVVVNFFILAAVIFIMIQFVNKLTNKKDVSKETELQVLSDIRSLLRKS
ncbi:large conductance mechanosensitive channel protein MscL [Candidatus Liberibacter americanus]|uniref:large conductance mechanosensitive channel protein MscL n=1 Tax=Candidatus Liberibacter americanus TaxID=309868 RepID=UPI0002C6071C|nr:large conductance mechanosensitive channel protein MscL [Candidatus Liberibacter americanus]EMS36336.1 large conductance mechanosensitive channel protein [Candidatus Liberibacter americanus PW_SP]